MELSQKILIPLAPHDVWLALNDPLVLKQCLPGCEEFELLTANRYHILILAKVGPVKARFTGEVEISNINAPFAYTMSGSGKGGVAGFAKGSADVRLDSIYHNDLLHTSMSYQVNAAVGGKLAQIGSRLVSGAAKKMANDFFTNFVRVACNDLDGLVAIQLETLSKEEG